MGSPFDDISERARTDYYEKAPDNDDTITYREVLTRDLKVMDATATALCSDNNMSMIVFNIDQPHVFADALKGLPVGTTVVGEETH